MSTWNLLLAPVAGEGGATYRRLANQIVSDIKRGRLHPGERLPSTRRLAAQLGVNRNTVVAAYEVLRADGWIEGRTTSGTFIAHPPQLDTSTAPGAPGFELPDAPSGQWPIPRSPGRLMLLGGVPDLRLVPRRKLARAYARVLTGPGGRRAMDYADPQGNAHLRGAIGDLLSRTRGLISPSERICVVRGSQQGLYLIAAAMVRPGDRVAVEALGYPPAWTTMRLAGARLVPIPVDEDGLVVDALAAAIDEEPVRAVVTTPHHQHPTTVTMPPRRRHRLLELASRTGTIVVEDDYDHDFHYDGQPIVPLAATDGGQQVVYVGSLSKGIAPGLRLGYVVAHPDVIQRVVAHRTYMDVQGDQVLERAVADLLEDGTLQQHLRRIRRIYRDRRDALCGALRSQLPCLSFRTPTGGMAVWARAPPELGDTQLWVDRALHAGVAVQAGAPLSFSGDASAFLRIGFAACDEEELTEAIRRLASVIGPCGREPP